jgi:two-component system chemotaxis response regulator CheB
MKELNVLVIDELALSRSRIMENLKLRAPHLSVETTSGPQFVPNRLQRRHTDCLVIVLRGMIKSGLFLIAQVMSHRPMPVFVLYTEVVEKKHIDEAWARGAVDVIAMEESGTATLNLDLLIQSLNEKGDKPVKQALHPDAMYTNIFTEEAVPEKPGYSRKERVDEVIVIGSSTGGVEVITKMIPRLRSDLAPILIVQHMPEGFTASFSATLNRNSAIHVQEAEDGEELFRGMALVAPGQRHLKLFRKRRASLFARVTDEPPVNLFRPSVDYLFDSVLENPPDHVTAVILTGMGREGSQSLLRLRQAGAVTIAQDEATSAVYGMPREAVQAGGVQHVLSVDGIIDFLNRKIS